MTSTANEDEARERAVDWLMQVQASPDDAELRRDLDRWLAQSPVHRRAYAGVQRVWRVAEGLPGEGDPASPAAMPMARPGRLRTTGWSLAAAVAIAACLLLVVLPAIQLRLEADAITGTAELRDLVLDDGSEVHLDAGSAVAIDYGEARRQVRLLTGEAFFEVVHGTRPFVVRAGGVTVTVVGTAFSVRAGQEAVAVAVRSGIVEVRVGGRPLPERLTPGERLRIDSTGGVERGEVAPGDIAAWRQWRMVVDGMPLTDVVETLGRHYDGMIVLRDPSLAARRVTGVFDLGRPIEALETVARAQHGSITRITPYVTLVSGP
ncbi:FecR family protein [Reyranella sp.]|uniref:FecR family protein n=1 Tax=Reyranella sp. TaxID=1929291 RepID=UPI003BA8E145